MEKIKIASYNILSQKLTSRYVQDEHIKDKNRYNTVLNKITDFVDEDYIICLQELGRSWYVRLLPFFHSRDYTIIYRSYSSKGQDFMGVAIAFSNRYTVEDVDIYRIVDAFSDNYQKDKKSNKLFTNILQDKVANFSNDIISVKLKIYENTFYVCTCHIPNVHKHYADMYCYVKSVSNYVKDLSKKGEVILTGDFNITEKYHFSLEDMMTNKPDILDASLQKTLDKLFDDKPKGNLISVYQNRIDKMITSNYPNIQDESEFNEVLDYIFITKNFIIFDLLKVELYPEKSPNVIQGSDHLPIGVTLILK